MEPFETFEHAGCSIHLYYDDDPMPPSDWDTLGTLYAIGRSDWRAMDDSAFSRAEECMERGGAALLRRYLRLCHGVYAVACQVNDYGSSGVRLYTDNGPADDGYCNAYIVATPESIEMTGVPLERIEDGLRAELDEWRAYFENEVVGYVVECNGETIDSCWSFYPESKPSEPEEDASDAYRAAWQATDVMTRPYVEAVAQAFDAAEHEQAERERATMAGIPMIEEGR